MGRQFRPSSGDKPEMEKVKLDKTGEENEYYNVYDVVLVG